MPGFAIAAILLALTGSVLIYAGARHQRLTAATGRRPQLSWLGAAALLASIALLLQWFGSATAVFAWLTLAMLAWSIVPLAVAWWRRPRGTAR